MSEPSQPTTTAASRKTSIKIGDIQYDIDISKIPYLSSFVNFQAHAQPQSTEFIHGPIPLFDIALKGIESGYRQCFRSLPSDLAQYHTLCETYEFLCANILNEQSIDQISRDLKSGHRRFKGNLSKARDAAFKLLYFILLGDFKDPMRDSSSVFNAVLFVASHALTFNSRTRRVLRAAYEERFFVSPRQSARLDDAASMAVELYGDATTEEEGWDPYHSD